MPSPEALDDNGWLVGDVHPLEVSASYSVLAPERSSMLNGARLQHQAKKFFRLDLTVLTDKRYPAGGYPDRDWAAITLSHANEERRLDLFTLPLDRAPAVRRSAVAAAGRIGAGFDVLVERAVRLWQIPAARGDDPFPLALAAVLASVLLGPILPPTEDAVFGVKTARERLASLGWRT